MALNAEVLTSYKKIDEAYIDELLKKEIEKNNKKIVVLDDDPTGVQTVHDISVYTNWEKDTIRQGFDEENNLFYVLTNSRGFTAEQTTKAHNEIAAVVDEVAKETAENLRSRSWHCCLLQVVFLSFPLSVSGFHRTLLLLHHVFQESVLLRFH